MVCQSSSVASKWLSRRMRMDRSHGVVHLGDVAGRCTSKIFTESPKARSQLQLFKKVFSFGLDDLKHCIRIHSLSTPPVFVVVCTACCSIGGVQLVDPCKQHGGNLVCAGHIA